MIEQSIELLGLRGKDKVTGFEGVLDSVCFDLYGCVQVSLAPSAEGKDEVKNGRWFDVNRIEVGAERVMDVPDFKARDNSPANYDKGPAAKAPPRG